MRVLLLSVVLLGCHRDLDDDMVADTGTVAETSVEIGIEDSLVADAPMDTCECAPGEVAAGTGTCPGVLEKKTKTCTTRCTWGVETCALPKGWTAIAAPSAFAGRLFPASAWTGGELIVHGGQKQPEGGATFADGAVYSVAKNSWTALPTTNAPTARGSHTGVWTGLEFIMWGGADGSTYRGDGAIYDAFTKSWRALPAPPISARAVHTAVWVPTTREMIVWGGRNDSGHLGDGASYSVDTATWTKLPTAPISARSLHVMAWTGTEALVWGGQDGSERFTDGALYDPAKKAWRAIPASAVAGRIFPSTALTSDRFVFFGGLDTGSLNDGASLSLVDLKWTPMVTPASSIYEPRDLPASWHHGGGLFLWSGGRGTTTVELLSSGAKYDVKTSTWSTLPAAGAPSPRFYATTASTASGGIVWSGIGNPGGGIFETLTDGAIHVP